MTDKFEMHALVEIMGHVRIAGKVIEQTIAGKGFFRVDVPKTTKRDGFTRFYGADAIYSITPVDEQIARLMAESLEVEPVSEWTISHTLKNLLPAGTTGPVPGDGREDWDSSYELPDDDGDDWRDERFFPDEDDEIPKEIPGVDYSGDALPPDAPSGEIEKPRMVSKRLEDKRTAAQWARDLLKGEFVIFDTETTGFESDDEIIQIGIIDHTGATVLEQLIKPTKPILNTEYHGITDEMVKDAPGFPEVYERIKAALEGKTVVAYNWSYDSKMVDQVCRKHGLGAISWTLPTCAMEEYAQYNGEWNDYHGNYRWKKLREALAAFGLKHEDFGTKAHDACTDARATLAVIKKMAEFEAEKPAAAADLPL